MANFEKQDFSFLSAPLDDDIEIEIVDDTPEEDKINATPMPKEIVDEFEADDLESYSKEAKQRILQAKKLINDERRAKEAALKENEEAIRLANTVINENKLLKSKLFNGEKVYVSTAKEKLASDLEKARKEYKDAYDSGDADRLVEAQEKLTEIQFKSKEMDRYQPQYEENDLQFSNNDVKLQTEKPPTLDSKTQSWLDKNKWYGTDEEMSFLAMATHKRLEQSGVAVGSDYYWSEIDANVRKRFPEKFDDDVETKNSTKTRKSTVVAPATRSTSSKKIQLSPRQLDLCRKLKITPEEYHKQTLLMESQNG